MAFDWKKTLGVVAPLLGTAVGGPLGGSAVKAIGDALGLSDATEETIATAIQGANPEQLGALKAADQAFRTKMKELDIDLERIDASDRDSARKREATTGDTWTPRLLATIIVVGFFGMLTYMMVQGLPKGVGGSEAFLILLGALAAAFGAVVNYYFGSSSSSKSKDDTIKAMSR